MQRATLQLVTTLLDTEPFAVLDIYFQDGVDEERCLMAANCSADDALEICDDFVPTPEWFEQQGYAHLINGKVRILFVFDWVCDGNEDHEDYGESLIVLRKTEILLYEVDHIDYEIPF